MDFLDIFAFLDIYSWLVRIMCIARNMKWIPIYSMDGGGLPRGGEFWQNKVWNCFSCNLWMQMQYILSTFKNHFCYYSWLKCYNFNCTVKHFWKFVYIHQHIMWLNLFNHLNIASSFTDLILSNVICWTFSGTQTLWAQ